MENIHVIYEVFKKVRCAYCSLTKYFRVLFIQSTFLQLSQEGGLKKLLTSKITSSY